MAEGILFQYSKLDHIGHVRINDDSADELLVPRLGFAADFKTETLRLRVIRSAGVSHSWRAWL